MHLLLDLETRSRVDLKKAGARRYAADPSTQITTAGWRWKGRPERYVSCHVPGYEHLGNCHPSSLPLHVKAATKITAHNAAFDVNILRHQFPELVAFLTVGKLDCTMARAQRMALPGGLDQLCATLGLPGKTPEGGKLVMATCKPRRDGEFNESVDLFTGLIGYMGQDVQCLDTVDDVLPQLPLRERLIWERTWRKNDLGLPLDLQLVQAIADCYGTALAEVARELWTLTGGAVTALSQRQRIAEFLGLPGTKKEVIAEALERDDWDWPRWRVLNLVQENGGTAPAKAAALLDRHVQGWFKDATRYFGTRSGRGTSEGVNTFNISRPSNKHDVDQLITGLKAGRGGEMSNQMLIDSLRGMICAPEGWHVVDVDLSNIELRLALWYAGDAERLRVLRKGGDLYLFNARAFYGIPADATKASHPGERQSSKSATLGGQYGIGGDRFYLQNEAAIAKGELPASARMTREQCHALVQTYRRGNPLLAGRGGLWEQLETAMRSAMHQPGTIWSAAGGKVQFFHDGQKLDICLPSGRTLPHWHARFEDGDIVFNRAKNGRMMRQKTYGGAITEIVCQAAGRDILTAAEADIERELTDCHLILDVYDSVLFLAPAAVAEQRKEQAFAILRREREWTAGLPLDAEGYSAERMKK